MKKFNHQDELKSIIANKQLVEIDLSLSGKLDHFIAYVLDVNNDYLTFTRISNDLALQGVTVCRMNDVESIQTETVFVKELEKGITDDFIQREAVREIEKVKAFTFAGFISVFEGTKTMIEITCEDNESFAGRIVGHDERFLILDEYFAGDNGRFARSYINPAIITSITVGGTWLKIISRSLADKNI